MTDAVAASPSLAGRVSVPEAMRSPRVLDPARAGDHIDRLYRAAWALCGSREQAEDLVQETYVRVLSRPRLLRGDDDLGYLLRALRNTFVSQHRAAAARPQLSGDEALDRYESQGVPGPEEALEASALYALIAALPTAFREALVAVDVVGLSYREASRALRVREGTLTSRLYRAREQLARSLSEER